MSFFIICLIAGKMQVREKFSCPLDKGARCWEVGEEQVNSIPAIACVDVRPSGMMRSIPCPMPEPKKYIVELTCDAWPASPEVEKP